MTRIGILAGVSLLASVLALPASNAAVAPAGAWADNMQPANVTAGDALKVELGLRFKPTTNGRIDGIRFYKGVENTGTHTATLWSSTGTALATATFVNESNSGWQTVRFSAPVAVTADTTYVASYLAPKGRYSYDYGYFVKSAVRGSIKTSTNAGLYRYGGGFPTQAFRASNYWVDVLFAAASAPTSSPPTTQLPTSTTAKPTTTTAKPTTTTAKPTTTTAKPTTTTAPPLPTTTVPSGTDCAHRPLPAPNLAGAFPNSDNAGAPADSWDPETGEPRLPLYNGTHTITVDGTLIEGKLVRGDLTIRANCVVIKNSIVRGIIYNDGTDGVRPGSVWIEDSTVNGGNSTMGAIGNTNFTLIRVAASGGQHVVMCYINCRIQDSFLTNPFVQGGTHNNTFITNGGHDMELRHNTLHCNVANNDTGGGCSSDLSIFGDFEANYNITIDSNYFGANTEMWYCSYGGTSGKPYKAHHVTYTNNVFARGTNGKCGNGAPITDFDQNATGSAWSNNRWSDGVLINPDGVLINP